MRARALAVGLALADARPAAAASQAGRGDHSAERVLFYNDSLAIVVRNGVTMRLAGGAVLSGDAAYVDLRNYRAVIAGDASIARGAAVTCTPTRWPSTCPDARSTPQLFAPSDHRIPCRRAAPAFVFPDLADKQVHRARTAEIVSKHERALSAGRVPHVDRGAAGADVSPHVRGRQRLRRDRALPPPRSINPTGLVSTPQRADRAASALINGVGAVAGHRAERPRQQRRLSRRCARRAGARRDRRRAQRLPPAR